MKLSSPNPKRAEQLAIAFQLAERRPGRIGTSELTLAELAAGSVWARFAPLYIDLLIYNVFVDLRPVSRKILLATGDYRRALRTSDRSVKLPDAIHAVTAMEAHCRYVFTSDKRFVAPSSIETPESDANGLRLVIQALDA